MLLGAFAAYYTVILSGNAWLGLVAALVVGVLMGVLLGVVNVSLKATQGISGIGVYLFGLGLSDLLFQKFVGTARSVRGFQELPIPLLSDIPVVGKIFFNTVSSFTGFQHPMKARFLSTVSSRPSPHLPTR